jgi:SAM-dependent methyltransferase
VYDDAVRADAYATLEFPGTYYLAYRDLPNLIARHVQGTSALDFGCGAGRSTRFLRGLGFEAVGVDISAPMIHRAQERDPAGDYRLVANGDLDVLGDRTFDLVLAAFTFDNVPMEDKTRLCTLLGRRLAPHGRFINLVSAPAIYVNEWVSFSTKTFAANRTAASGDTVLIEMRDVDDRRPISDVLCTDEDYRTAFARAALESVAVHRPLGRPNEPYPWDTELTISPWTIYVLRRREHPNADNAIERSHA